MDDRETCGAITADCRLHSETFPFSYEAQRCSSLLIFPHSSQQQNASSQAPSAGRLFGATSQNTQTQQGTGAFGNAQPQAATGSTGSLFGNSTAQPQQGSSLFGITQAQAGGSSGLFGGATQQQQQQQPQQNTGLFGASAAQPQQQSSNLFGAKPTTSLFGTSTQQQTQNNSNAFGGGNTSNTMGSLFGGNQAKPTASLFGGLGNDANKQQMGSSLFNTSVAQQAPSNSIFGLSAAQPQQPSLLAASQYMQSQNLNLPGKLTMGQPNAAPAMTGPVKVNYDLLRPTTRFGECIDEVKSDLERIDKMIQSQERFCREIEAFLPKIGRAHV